MYVPTHNNSMLCKIEMLRARERKKEREIMFCRLRRVEKRKKGVTKKE